MTSKCECAQLKLYVLEIELIPNICHDPKDDCLDLDQKPGHRQENVYNDNLIYPTGRC